ncbi:hypothetical protein VPNG_02109 [Cytospora leucostoma]|uniref:DUF7924 domain-containing protein n=1 Tax=Cytospora leucostoma TaxID=1230097 RepID=A0A423XGY8_9PEZI|nr:hypothetical protein VPNG_02109 [Cytospora leucostoma]
MEDRPVKRLREDQCIVSSSLRDHSRQLPREVEYDPIGHWAREGSWPRQYFQQGSTIEHFLARKKPPSSISSEQYGPHTAGSITPSDQRPRGEKALPYRDHRYPVLLETKGSFMHESELGLTEESKELCQHLLENPQEPPRDSLFRDDLFATTCRQVAKRNKARILRDITPLIVPSAETLCTYGSSALGCLIEGLAEPWENSIPLTAGTPPRPDYAVGFRRQAFTDDQLDKLSPFIGDFLAGDRSLFMATYTMYFPFLACEVPRGGGEEDLEVADRRNAHAMTLAARAVADLFRLVGRGGEVDRRVLGFSVSHDGSMVRICAHYPVMTTGGKTKYYRHTVRTLDFTGADGRDRWVAYRFTRNLYERWVPEHFGMVCSAIDQIPSHLDFNVSPVPETGCS